MRFVMDFSERIQSYTGYCDSCKQRLNRISVKRAVQKYRIKNLCCRHADNWQNYENTSNTSVDVCNIMCFSFEGMHLTVERSKLRHLVVGTELMFTGADRP